jgi:hypothetical protein
LSNGDRAACESAGLLLAAASRSRPASAHAFDGANLDRFPAPLGGNSIPVVQGGNLHVLWDNLLGRRHRPHDVKREVAELRERPTLWKVDLQGDVTAWIQESHELAKSFAYSLQIIEAIKKPDELQKTTCRATTYPPAASTPDNESLRLGCDLRLCYLTNGSC